MNSHTQPHDDASTRKSMNLHRLREMRVAGNSISMLTCLGASFAHLFVRQVKSETFPDDNLHGL